MKKIFVNVGLLTILLVVFWFTLLARVSQPEYSLVVDVPDDVTPPVEQSAEPEATPTPTPTPTPEPTPEYFTLSFIGDCTLAPHQNTQDYFNKVGDDYAYPFAKTVQYFADDEYTFANLECTFSDRNLSAVGYPTFYFRAPTSYVNILLEGGVDFVTTANNHFSDFGDKGAEDTYATLDNAGLPYGKVGQAQVVTTKNGIKIGVYCGFNINDGYFVPTTDECIDAINQMKADGAEYIVMAFHWGKELYYKPTQKMIDLAQACIDAGADLIYGTHPHVLGPVVEYNGGIIMYSVGNWSFGGNTQPTDQDTAIIQVTIKRDLDGSITTEGYDAIPCCVSSNMSGGVGYNDYKPTPYPEDNEGYKRVLSKLDMNSGWENANKDYSAWYSAWG